MNDRYDFFLQTRDLQMLAMLALFLLHSLRPPSSTQLKHSHTATTPAPPSSPYKLATPSSDYFSRSGISKSQHIYRDRDISPPGWPRLPSTPSPVVTPPTASTNPASVTGRGSWSSLFHTSLSRQPQKSPDRPTPDTSIYNHVRVNSNSPVGVTVPAPRRMRPHRMSDAGPGAVFPREAFPVPNAAATPLSTSWDNSKSDARDKDKASLLGSAKLSPAMVRVVRRLPGAQMATVSEKRIHVVRTPDE
jgi:hypothetical protein